LVEWGGVRAEAPSVGPRGENAPNGIRRFSRIRGARASHLPLHGRHRPDDFPFIVGGCVRAVVRPPAKVAGVVPRHGGSLSRLLRRPHAPDPSMARLSMTSKFRSSSEDAALLALLHDAGLPVSEAAALARSDVECKEDGSAGIVSVRGGKTGARIVAVSGRPSAPSPQSARKMLRGRLSASRRGSCVGA